MSQQKILLAVSGGLDSMVLLHMYLRSHGAERIAVAHCNFGLRGEESDGDATFVRTFCETHHVRCFIKTFDTAGYAHEQKVSTQEAARVLRYTWFEKLTIDHGLEAILTAHHFDDSVETFMINLMRGTGLDGLIGIPRQRGKIFRPLLEKSRQEIQQYADTHRISWREDSSNSSDKYTRNRIRHELLPLMHDIRSSFPSSMTHTIRHLQKMKDLLHGQVEEFKEAHCTAIDGGFNIDIARLEKRAQAELFLYELLVDHGFSLTQLNDLLGTERIGAKILSSEWALYRDRDMLMLRPHHESSELAIQIHEPGNFDVLDQRLELHQVAASEVTFSAEPWTIHVDQSSIQFPLTIRPWRAGDELMPLGMKGNKKVSDILIDAKVPLPDKKKVHVMEDAKGIFWLMGYRMSERVKLNEESVKAIRIALSQKM